MQNTFATCINMRVGPNQFIYIPLFYLRKKSILVMNVSFQCNHELMNMIESETEKQQRSSN